MTILSSQKLKKAKYRFLLQKGVKKAIRQDFLVRDLKLYLIYRGCQITSPPPRFDLSKKFFCGRNFSYTGGRVQESSLKSRGSNTTPTVKWRKTHFSTSSQQPPWKTCFLVILKHTSNIMTIKMSPNVEKPIGRSFLFLKFCQKLVNSRK